MQREETFSEYSTNWHLVAQRSTLDWPNIQKKSFFHESRSFPGSVGSTDFRKVSHSLLPSKLTSRWAPGPWRHPVLGRPPARSGPSVSIPTIPLENWCLFSYLMVNIIFVNETSSWERRNSKVKYSLFENICYCTDKLL